MSFEASTHSLEIHQRVLKEHASHLPKGSGAAERWQGFIYDPADPDGSLDKYLTRLQRIHSKVSNTEQFDYLRSYGARLLLEQARRSPTQESFVIQDELLLVLGLAWLKNRQTLETKGKGSTERTAQFENDFGKRQLNPEWQGALRIYLLTNPEKQASLFKKMGTILKVDGYREEEITRELRARYIGAMAENAVITTLTEGGIPVAKPSSEADSLGIDLIALPEMKNEKQDAFMLGLSPDKNSDLLEKGVAIQVKTSHENTKASITARSTADFHYQTDPTATREQGLLYELSRGAQTLGVGRTILIDLATPNEITSIDPRNVKPETHQDFMLKFKGQLASLAEIITTGKEE